MFENVKLPEGKVLIPGVIESKANFIEHPELIAQRICACRAVGRENVIAGSDCGYGTWSARRRRPRCRVGQVRRDRRGRRSRRASSGREHSEWPGL